jgi:hypothetical protein
MNTNKSAIETLIQNKPFMLNTEQKKTAFRQAMKEAFQHHIDNNPLFAKYCTKKGLDIKNFPKNLEDLPYIPVKLFKSNLIASVNEKDIKKRLHSSATSGVPSTVALDQITSKRQALVSSKVISEYIGNHRRPFLILDEDPRESTSQDINARLAATTGFLLFSSDTDYLLQPNAKTLTIDKEKLQDKFKHYETTQEEVCIFGFTYILYHHVIRPLKEMGISFKLPPSTKICHIGGWKKLENQKVSKEIFLEDIHQVLSIPKENIIDFYGFTEQMGLVYANTGNTPKSVHNYAEVIIRDIQTLKPAKLGEEGFIQILTPVPHSYPGISVLTEDIGKIVDNGPDENGRPGNRFEIIGRAKKAEARGCGDIMSEYVDE